MSSPLQLRAFGFGHADLRLHFKIFDFDRIHRCSSPRCSHTMSGCMARSFSTWL